MVLVKNPVTGEWEQVAGNGRAEYGASTVRTGTITTDEIGIGSFAVFTVTFDTPMPDSDYRITWDWNTAGGNLTFGIVTITEKTANGFKLYVRNSDVTANPLTSHVLTWYAFKLYTDTEYTSILNTVNSLDTLTRTTVAVPNGGVKLAKYGRIVQVSFQIVGDNLADEFTSGVWTNYGSAGVIPEIYRPLNNVYCGGLMVVSSPVLMRVTTGGNLNYYYTGGNLGYEFEWSQSWISAT